MKVQQTKDQTAHEEFRKIKCNKMIWHTKPPRGAPKAQEQITESVATLLYKKTSPRRLLRVRNGTRKRKTESI